MILVAMGAQGDKQGAHQVPCFIAIKSGVASLQNAIGFCDDVFDLVTMQCVTPLYSRESRHSHPALQQKSHTALDLNYLFQPLAGALEITLAGM